MHMHGALGPVGSALPTGPNVYPVTGARYADESVLVGLSDNRCYIANGDSIRQVMIAGTQIPGQAPGVVWGGRFWAALWPIPGGASFTAFASGPGIGDTPTPVAFVGSFDGPVSMDVASFGALPSTTTGLATRSTPDALFAVGPVSGPFQTVIPRGYRPPGATHEASFRGTVRLNNAGTLGLTMEAPIANGSRTYAIVADTNSIAVRATSREAIQTDRGTIAMSTLGIGSASQPLGDGSIFVGGTAVINGTNRLILWLAPPSGLRTVVALGGDHAPGTEPGVIFRPAGTLNPLAVNRNGSLLFLATLEGPGVTNDNNTAIYLWRRGTLTLVARADSSSLYLPALGGAVALNSHDDVGIITNTQARLFKPGVGTLIVARRNEPINPSSGLSGNVLTLSSFMGSLSNTSTSAGNDDLSLSCLSEAGELLVFGNANGHFAISFSITSPGCPADFNLDGFTDFFDYLDFVTCFEGGRCPDGKVADFNDDGIADFFDYMGFVEAFETGC